MYKSELEEALAGLLPAPGTPIEGLIKEAAKAETSLAPVLDDFLLTGNNANKAINSYSSAHGALATLGNWIAQISAYGMAVEFHELGKRFDDVLLKRPGLEPLLRPGRQALAELSGKFDAVLKHNKHPSSLIGLLKPAAMLATCFAFYAAVKNLFSNEFYSEKSDDDGSVVIEVAGADSLGAFATYISMLSYLAGVAAEVLSEVDGATDSSLLELRIESIESGSPVQIKLFGDGRTIRFLLTMLKDAIHSRTPHGRLQKAIDTLACAKKVGIKSPELLKRLEDAVAITGDQYVASLREHDVTVSIDGQAVRDPLSLPPPVSDDGQPALPPPQD